MSHQTLKIQTGTCQHKIQSGTCHNIQIFGWKGKLRSLFTLYKIPDWKWCICAECSL